MEYNYGKIKTDKYFYIQIVFATAFTLLTGGIFLSGLALYMEASDSILSYISVIPNICGITILFVAFFLEKFASKKKLSVLLTLVAKLTTCLIIFIPLLVDKKYQIYFFVILVVISYTLQALSTVALNNWMLHFIPESREGRFVSTRQTYSLVITIILSLSAGKLMDASENEYTGFLILYLLGFLMAIFEILTLLKVEDVKVNMEAKKKIRKSDILRLPLKNKTFINYIIYVSLFYILLYISDSFTTVYMMKYLKLPYGLVVGFQLIMSLPQVFLLRIWGRISDKHNHKMVLSLSIWFFVGETFFLGLTKTNNYFIFIPLAFLIGSIANSGFAIALFNRRYEIVPEEGRMVFDCFFSAVIGLAFILGPMIGGLIKNLISANGRLAGAMEFSDIRLLFFISAIGIIMLQCCNIIKNKRKRDTNGKN